MPVILLLIIIYLAFIGLGLPDALLGSAWPSMYALLNVPVHYAGIISMIIAGGAVVSSVFSAKIIARFGTGPVAAFSVFTTAAALTGFSFSVTFESLCICAVPLGLGAGSVDAGLNNYVALHYKARHMSWLHCFWGIGASTGPLVVSLFLADNSSWNSGYRTIAVIQFCLSAILFASLPLWKKEKTKPNGAPHDSIPFKTLFAIPGVKQILIAFFCYCTIETTTGLWGASFLVIVKGVRPEQAAKWIALYYSGITLGRFVSGFVTIKLNGRQMVRSGQAVIASGIVILLLPAGNGAMLPAFFLIGLGCAPIYPGLLHETPVNFGKKYSQAIMGIQMASAYIGVTLMPTVFGRLAAYMSFNIFPIFIGIILIVKIIMVETCNRLTASARKEYALVHHE